jgi:hypothetical protein
LSDTAKKRKVEHPVWEYFEVKNDGVPFPSTEQIRYMQQLLPIIGPIKNILHEIQAEKFVSISKGYMYIQAVN